MVVPECHPESGRLRLAIDKAENWPQNAPELWIWKPQGLGELSVRGCNRCEGDNAAALILGAGAWPLRSAVALAGVRASQIQRPGAAGLEQREFQNGIAAHSARLARGRGRAAYALLLGSCLPTEFVHANRAGPWQKLLVGRVMCWHVRCRCCGFLADCTRLPVSAGVTAIVLALIGYLAGWASRASDGGPPRIGFARSARI